MSNITVLLQRWDISPATVKRYWSFARAWLFRGLGDQGGKSPSPA